MTDVASFTHGGATLVAESDGGAGGGGARGECATYLFIHGIGMGRSIFAELAERLRAGGSRTIAIDLPGYGEAPEPRRVLTMERTADLVAAYARSRDVGRIIFVGHSMGTQVAVEVGARHPDLVEKIVLIGPTVDPRERTAPRQLLRLAQDLLVENPRVIAIGAREYVRAGPNLRPKFRAMLVHKPEETYPRVPAPTLVLRGENDLVCARDWCRTVANALPDGRLAEVAGHGHETMIRDAAPSAALIQEFVGA